MKRRIVRLLGFAGLVMAVAIALLSLRGGSYVRRELYQFGQTADGFVAHTGNLFVERTNSQLAIGFVLDDYDINSTNNAFLCPFPFGSSVMDMIKREGSYRGSIGLMLQRRGNPQITEHVAAAAAPPLAWIGFALLLTLPAFAMELTRRKDCAESACQSCGYDLRATPHRCPECGATPLHDLEPAAA